MRAYYVWPLRACVLLVFYLTFPLHLPFSFSCPLGLCCWPAFISGPYHPDKPGKQISDFFLQFLKLMKKVTNFDFVILSPLFIYKYNIWFVKSTNFNTLWNLLVDILNFLLCNLLELEFFFWGVKCKILLFYIDYSSKYLIIFL